MLKTDRSAKELEKFRERLTGAGLKATAQRMAVHLAMMELGHASADMVCEWLKKNSQTKVAQASVYNILTQLALIHIYGYRMSANNKMYFDVNTRAHFHLYDCVNHTFRDINDDGLSAELIEKTGNRRFRGYKVENVDIQFVVRPAKKNHRNLSKR